MYIPLEYVYEEWKVRRCTSTEDQDYKLKCEEWLKNWYLKLPTPKKNAGDKVKFRFGNHIMSGQIQKIELSYKDDEVFLNGIYYTIYANGHGRWVDESCLIL